MKKKVGTRHFRGLVELSELKTKASETFPFPGAPTGLIRSSQNSLSESSLRSFTIPHSHSFSQQLRSMCRALGFVLKR